MNAKEGLRRFGILLGAIGAIAGGFISFDLARPLLARRALHNHFESLLTTKSVQRELRYLYSQGEPSPPTNGLNGRDVFDAAAARMGDVNGWKVEEEGVKKIYFSNDALSSIEDDDNRHWDRIDAPRISEYLKLLLIPILGFFLPWGTLKAITWVLQGFVHTP